MDFIKLRNFVLGAAAIAYLLYGLSSIDEAKRYYKVCEAARSFFEIDHNISGNLGLSPLDEFMDESMARTTKYYDFLESSKKYPYSMVDSDWPSSWGEEGDVRSHFLEMDRAYRVLEKNCLESGFLFTQFIDYWQIFGSKLDYFMDATAQSSDSN